MGIVCTYSNDLLEFFLKEWLSSFKLHFLISLLTNMTTLLNMVYFSNERICAHFSLERKQNVLLVFGSTFL